MRFASFVRIFCCLTFTLLTLSAVQLPLAQAAIRTVTNLNDSGAGSLRDTIAGATAGDTISFSLSGMITLTSGQIVIDKNLIISGAGQNITISGNDASRIFQVNITRTVQIHNLTLRNALAGVQGGAILNNGTLTIGNSTLSSNVGSAGGAIFTDGSLTINNSTFNNNTTTNANMGGGAIYNNSGTLVISESTFSGNQTPGSGGAIVGGTTTINNSTISGNTAAKVGGGVLVIVGTLIINNSTISGNTATADDAGGIYSSDVLNMTNSTVYDNHAGTNGGGVWSANATINSSTISDNTAATGANIFVSTNTTTISRSIINNGGCTLTGGGILTDGGNNIAFSSTGCPGINSNPLLGELDYNEGVTQTIPLLESSPAIDVYSTNCPAADQRGMARPQGAACDIGAYERQPSITRFVTNLNDNGAGSLRATIASATAGDKIVFNVSGTITLTSGPIGLLKNLIIDGSGQSITISGNNLGQIFFSFPNRTEIRNLSLINGRVTGTTFGAVMDFFNLNGILIIDNVIFEGNTSDSAGGAIKISGGRVTINNSTFSGNSVINSGGSGGAIYHYNAILTINNSTFSNNTINTSNSSGGAISTASATGNGQLTINNSTFSSNSAAIGGAIASNSARLTINNSTFSGNSATNGSLLYATDNIYTSIIDINSSTFSNNIATNGDTIFTELDFVGSTTEINTSILSGGSCSGTIIDGGNNIAFNTSGCPGINTNPLLGALGDYGGITQSIPLLTGSPAIDAYSTNCPAADQRGIIRPQGAACDIGAYEAAPIALIEATINENEFFAALEAAHAGYPDINQIIVDFIPNAMNLTIMTTGGVVGVVRLELTQAQGFTTFTIASVTVNGAAAPASYLTIINRDLPVILTTALDALIVERFGSLIDVQMMTMNGSALVISTAP